MRRRDARKLSSQHRLAGTKTETIVAAFGETMSRPVSGRVPPLWDGKSAGRIVAVLTGRLQRG